MSYATITQITDIDDFLRAMRYLSTQSTEYCVHVIRPNEEWNILTNDQSGYQLRRHLGIIKTHRVND